MKYKERDQLVQDLRDTADLIEAKGLELPGNPYVSISFYSYEYDCNKIGTTAKEVMARAAKALAPVEKNYDSFSFDLTKKVGMIEIRLSTSRTSVCTKKVVGTKKVQKRVYVDVPNEFVDEEVVEWECDPLLA